MLPGSAVEGEQSSGRIVCLLNAVFPDDDDTLAETDVDAAMILRSDE